MPNSCLFNGRSFAGFVSSQSFLEPQHEIIDQGIFVDLDGPRIIVSGHPPHTHTPRLFGRLSRYLTFIPSSAMIASIIKTIELRAITEKGDATRSSPICIVENMCSTNRCLRCNGSPGYMVDVSKSHLKVDDTLNKTS